MLTQTRYAVFINTRNVSVETVCTNFDEQSASKLSHYVNEVVDNLIDTTTCWFTVLNANVLMDQVCSLAVRKFLAVTPDEKQKKFFIACYVVNCNRGIDVFKSELNHFSQNIFDEYQSGAQLESKISGWYNTCATYISDLLADTKNLFENILYKLALGYQITSNKRSLERFNESFPRGVTSAKPSLEVIERTKIFNIDSATYDQSLSTEFIKKIVDYLIQKNDPILIKKIVIRFLEDVFIEYKELCELYDKSDDGYFEYTELYLRLKNSPFGTLVLDMLKQAKDPDLPHFDCISIIDQHIRGNVEV